MGFEILYCSGCQERLGEADFERKGARREGGKAACRKCVAQVFGEAAPEPPPPPRRQAVRPRPQPQPSVPAPKKGPPWLIIGGAAAAVLAIGIVAAIISGSDPEPPPPVVTSNPEPPKAPIPEPVPVKADPAAAAYEQAVAFAREHPNDLEGKLKACAEALGATRETAYYAKLKAQEQELLAEKEAMAVEASMKALDEKAAGQAFGAAIKIYQDARNAYGGDSWPGRIDGKIAGVNKAARELYAPLKEGAEAARRAGKADEEKKIRDQVAAWGIAALNEDLEKHLDAIVMVKPVSPAVLKYREEWTRAMALASARDFEGAVKSLEAAPVPDELKEEAAADLADLKAMAPLVAEAVKRLPAWPEDKELTVEVRGADGKTIAFSGMPLAIGPRRAEFTSGVVEWSDVTLASLAKILLGQGENPDKRRLAVLAVLEGDTSIAEGLSPKHLAYAKEAASHALNPAAREVEARQVFYEAEEKFSDMVTFTEAVEGYKRLKTGFGDTRLVTEELKLIESRLSLGRQWVLGAADLTGHGTFAKNERDGIGKTWEVKESSSYQSQNYVEFQFHALPETPYACWVRLGGCCLETIACSWQTNGLMMKNPQKKTEKLSVEPGSDFMAPIEIRNSKLRRTHEMHAKKEAPSPDKWEWVKLELPPVGSGGLKTVRIFSLNKGFGIAGAVVSADLKAPPKDEEIAAMMKARTAEAGRRRRGDGAELLKTYKGFEEVKNYTLVYDLELAKLSHTPAYTVDKSGAIKGKFDRVAYLLELGAAGGTVNYAYVSMDAFTDDLKKVGIPTVAADVTFQQGVTNLTVASNVSGVAGGTGLAGNIEFWPNNYGATNGAKVAGASDTAYDFGDQPGDPRQGYGCLQVHNTSAKHTILAVNKFGSGGSCDAGIGNSPDKNPDWTFTGAGAGHSLKRLRVLVRLR